MSALEPEGGAQHQLIVEEARRRGISTEHIPDNSGRAATLLKFGSKEELLIQGIPESWMSVHASRQCDDKQLTKQLFHRLKIPTLDSIEFATPEDLQSEGLFDGQKQFVCKPTTGTNGVGIGFDMRSIDDVRMYHKANAHLGPTFMLEEQHPGYDLRIQVIGGQIAAACKRLPAFVTGDGTKSLVQLITERRKVVRSQNPANDIIVDDETASLISKQGLTLNTIIPIGLEVQLKRISNMAQGGHAIDVTDELAPGFSSWIQVIAKALNSSYFALDVMCNDHKILIDGSAKALEINIRAEWMHHTFSEVRTHDLAKTVVDTLFKLELR